MDRSFQADASQPSIRDQLAELAAAVLAGDHDRAHVLAQTILQRLAREATERDLAEVQVRALLMALAARPSEDEPDSLMSFDTASAVRGSGGAVYPVWFGTNRKPAAGGASFTNERHTTTTRGRVHIPYAHRAGEMGSSLWKRLRRLDLRDDRLRVHRVEPRDRSAFYAVLNAAMQDARDDGDLPHALLFLHGYDNSFEGAATRAAQIGFDLQLHGATAFFRPPRPVMARGS